MSLLGDLQKPGQDLCRQLQVAVLGQGLGPDDVQSSRPSRASLCHRLSPEHPEHPCGSPGASRGGESWPKRCWGCPAGLLLELIRCWVPCWVLSRDVEPCSDTFPWVLSLPLPDKCTQGDDLCLPVREGDSAPAGAGSPPCFPCRELEMLRGCCDCSWLALRSQAGGALFQQQIPSFLRIRGNLSSAP